MGEEILLTLEGLDKLKAELKKLQELDRKEVIDRIKNAKDFGDLSENSEYADAKDTQAFIEGRIQELETMIKHATIVNNNLEQGLVGMGSEVIVEIEGKKETYRIVGSTESDPIEGKISAVSPVGKALMGKTVGDKVEVETPDGSIVYKILAVK